MTQTKVIMVPDTVTDDEMNQIHEGIANLTARQLDVLLCYMFCSGADVLRRIEEVKGMVDG